MMMSGPSTQDGLLAVWRLHFPPPDISELGLQPVGTPPSPKEEESHGSSQDPSHTGGGAKPGPPAVPRTPTLSPGASPPAKVCAHPPTEATLGPRQPGMVTSGQGNAQGTWPGHTPSMNSPGSKYRPQKTERGDLHLPSERWKVFHQGPT